MSNIVQFPIQDNQRVSIEKHQLEIKEQREKNGGEAYEKLKKWRTSIPMKDREMMAHNMESILNEKYYGIKTKNLKWNKHYASLEAFRCDLSRMRIPENEEPGRQLMAHAHPWTNLLELISSYLYSQGKNASLARLADKLTIGTRFHPIQKEQSSSTKFFTILKILGNQVDEEYGLLRIYREIAEQRAKYFSLNMEEIREPYRYWFMRPDYMIRTVSDFISEMDFSEHDVFTKKIGDLTQNDWDAIAELAPREYAINLEWRKNEMEEWQRHFTKETTLISSPNFADLCQANLWFDINVLPRWFIGYLSWESRNVFADLSHRLGEIINNQGTVDPLTLGHKVDMDSHCAYLVLYPDPGLDQIIPYLFCYSEEGSSFYPLQEEDLDDNESLERYGTFFEPKNIGKATISRSLLARIEDNLYEINESWNSSAKLLKTHPYLEWNQERKKSVDNFINQLLVPQKNHNKHKKNRRKMPPIDGR